MYPRILQLPQTGASQYSKPIAIANKHDPHSVYSRPDVVRRQLSSVPVLLQRDPNFPKGFDEALIPAAVRDFTSAQRKYKVQQEANKEMSRWT